MTFEIQPDYSLPLPAMITMMIGFELAFACNLKPTVFKLLTYLAVTLTPFVSSRNHVEVGDSNDDWSVHS
jgi:hypothetical protein